MVEQSKPHQATGLTQDRSFEFHRSGGSVEPADPGELARQDEDALEMTPLGERRDVRRGLLVGLACGVVLAVVLGALAALPWGVASTWPRIGVMALIGLLGGMAYGAVLGPARRAR